jgi:hypothetical protein
MILNSDPTLPLDGFPTLLLQDVNNAHVFLTIVYAGRLSFFVGLNAIKNRLVVNKPALAAQINSSKRMSNFDRADSDRGLIKSANDRIVADAANQQDSQHDLPYCTGNRSESFEITIELTHNFSLCIVTANDQHPISRHDKEKSWVKGNYDWGWCQ